MSRAESTAVRRRQVAPAVGEPANSRAEPLAPTPAQAASRVRAAEQAPAALEVSSRPTGRSLPSYLPLVVLATLVVGVLPIAIVWELRVAGIVTSVWIAPFLAIGLSSALSSAGCALWKRSKGSGDLLFSELLLWGWLGRWRSERQLVNAVDLLGLAQAGRPVKPGEIWPAERQEQLLRQVAETLEAVDRYTRGHSDRVARYAENIARKMGLTAQQIVTIRTAALVHDIGKLRTPPEVLNKPGRLTDEEFAIIKRHPVDGAEIVAGLGDAGLTAIVRHHHERLDGKGYPDGLAGDQIPLGARIIAVADTFDAITSVRPYRPRREHKKALDILSAEEGRQLDRDAVRAFLNCYSGTRTVAVWTIVTSTIQRVLTWVTGEASAATVTTGNLVATTVATVAIGGVAMTGSVIAPAHAHVPAGTPSSHAAERPSSAWPRTGASHPARSALSSRRASPAGPPGSTRRPAHGTTAGSARGLRGASARTAGDRAGVGTSSSNPFRSLRAGSRSATGASAASGAGAASNGTAFPGASGSSAPGAAHGHSSVSGSSRANGRGAGRGSGAVHRSAGAGSQTAGNSGRAGHGPPAGRGPSAGQGPPAGHGPGGDPSPGTAGGMNSGATAGVSPGAGVQNAGSGQGTGVGGQISGAGAPAGGAAPSAGVGPGITPGGLGTGVRAPAGGAQAALGRSAGVDAVSAAASGGGLGSPAATGR
ncbi:MAG TPA: HD-GYP domain-containing protein [Solirubrobacteraceae bacterium]|nr:HD-GYP domain-containing protein [Solirubrobacteraceae bacterium]